MPALLLAFRVHHVRRDPEDRAITIRIMPQGAIQRFEDSIDKAIEAGREWLRDFRRGY